MRSKKRTNLSDSYLMLKFQLLSLMNQQGTFCCVLERWQHLYKVAVVEGTGEGKMLISDRIKVEVFLLAFTHLRALLP